MRVLLSEPKEHLEKPASRFSPLKINSYFFLYGELSDQVQSYEFSQSHPIETLLTWSEIQTVESHPYLCSRNFINALSVWEKTPEKNSVVFCCFSSSIKDETLKIYVDFDHLFPVWPPCTGPIDHRYFFDGDSSIIADQLTAGFRVGFRAIEEVRFTIDQILEEGLGINAVSYTHLTLPTTSRV